MSKNHLLIQVANCNLQRRRGCGGHAQYKREVRGAADVRPRRPLRPRCPHEARQVLIVALLLCRASPLDDNYKGKLMICNVETPSFWPCREIFVFPLRELNPNKIILHQLLLF